MKCNQCNAAMINGVFCHETGCPNMGKKWNEDNQEFMTVYTCQECGCEYFYAESLESCCQAEEMEEEETLYDVFVRDWWVYADEHNFRVGNSAKKIVPGPGEKEYVAYGLTRDEAVEYCTEYNESHEPGELSRKAEF